MKTLHYDDSKDLTEGLITENDNGIWSQVGQVYPDFREEYGHKFAAAPQLFEALKTILPWAEQWIKYLRSNVGPGQGQGADEVFAKAVKALAKARGED